MVVEKGEDVVEVASGEPALVVVDKALRADAKSEEGLIGRLWFSELKSPLLVMDRECNK